jgi:hypothetical protein
MKLRIVIGVLVLLGACDRKHALGVAADSGPEAPNPDIPKEDAATADVFDATFPEDQQKTRDTGLLGSTSWTGWIENFQFGSGSDVIRLKLETDDGGNVAGHVVFGEGTPPAPATDPAAWYPPGTTDDRLYEYLYYIEGSSYSILHGSLVRGRARFDVSGFELWSGWCALQAALPGWELCGNFRASAANDTECFVYDDYGTLVPYACPRMYICSLNVCLCSEAGCSADTTRALNTFDLNLAGDTINGSLSFKAGVRNVHFTQDQSVE